MPDAAGTTESDETTPVYGPGAAGAASPGGDGSSSPTAAGESRPPRRVRTLDLLRAKAEGRRWAMLTSYDQYTAALFEESGVEAAARRRFGGEQRLRPCHDPARHGR